MQRSERHGERQGRDGPAAARTGGGDDGGESSDLRTKHGKCSEGSRGAPFCDLRRQTSKKKRFHVDLLSSLRHLLISSNLPHSPKQ